MKRQPQLRLWDELVVDNFAGGGGASTGIEAALGRHCDIAINHDSEAIAIHKANHPETKHYCEDIWSVDPKEACQGRDVGLAWFSPDCTHFSRAKGTQPVKKEIRGLAWVVIRWAKAVQPRVIILENVEEFQTWGPVVEVEPGKFRPCPERKGQTFKRWVRHLKQLGYAVEWKLLRACDYGTPTTRKRLFLIARCDGEAITWPEQTHQPEQYRTAADIIDWTVEAPSIFERKRPLAEATMRRIAEGMRRYVIEASSPYVVQVDGRPAIPTLIQTGYGERPGQTPRVPGLEKPLGTIVAGGAKHALVAAFIAKHYTGVVGHGMERPLGTITAKDHHSLVTAFLVKYYGKMSSQPVDSPLHTIRTKDCFALVTVKGQPYEVVDIGMRMLTPRELFTAQGFPLDYEIEQAAFERGHQRYGQPLTKTAQIRMAGNSVCPPLSHQLVAANYSGELRRVA